MKEITLTRGKSAIVDDDDYPLLSQHKWCTLKTGKTFYAVRRGKISEGRKDEYIYMHREILRTNQFVDHVDRNGLNNQKGNLRAVSHKQNLENTGLRSDNKSGYTGVYWNKGKQLWSAEIFHDGKKMHLGYHSEKNDAVSARKAAENRYFSHHPPGNEFPS
jgi:hypothetical protein